VKKTLWELWGTFLDFWEILGRYSLIESKRKADLGEQRNHSLKTLLKEDLIFNIYLKKNTFLKNFSF
jgi:hypothetical protein